MPYRKTKRRTVRRKGGGDFLNTALRAISGYSRQPAPPSNQEKKARKIRSIINKVVKNDERKLRSFKIPHTSKTLNLLPIKAFTDDGFEPEGDEAAKFLRVLEEKLNYDQLKLFSTDIDAWSPECSEIFLMNWNSTPSPRNMPSISTGSLYERIMGKKYKKSKKSKKSKKGKKGKTRRKTSRRH